MQEEPPQPIPPLTEEELQERQKLWDEIFRDHPANKVKLASLNERKDLGKRTMRV